MSDDVPRAYGHNDGRMEPPLDLAFLKDRYDYELDRTLQEYEAYYEGDPRTAEEEFTGNLRRSIIQAADANTELNDRRSKFLYRARIALFALLVGLEFRWCCLRH